MKGRRECQSWPEVLNFDLITHRKKGKELIGLCFHKEFDCLLMEFKCLLDRITMKQPSKFNCVHIL